MCSYEKLEIGTIGQILHGLPRFNLKLQKVSSDFHPESIEYWISICMVTFFPTSIMLIVSLLFMHVCCSIVSTKKLSTICKFKWIIIQLMILACISGIIIFTFMLIDYLDFYQTGEIIEKSKQKLTRMFSLGRRQSSDSEDFGKSILRSIAGIINEDISNVNVTLNETAQTHFAVLSESFENVTVSSSLMNKLVGGVAWSSNHIILLMLLTNAIVSLLNWIVIAKKYHRRVKLSYFLIFISSFLFLFTLVHFTFRYMIYGALLADFCKNSCLNSGLPQINSPIIEYYLHGDTAAFNPIKNAIERRVEAINGLENILDGMKESSLREEKWLNNIAKIRRDLQFYESKILDLQQTMDDKSIPIDIHIILSSFCSNILTGIGRMLIYTFLIWILFHLVILGFSAFPSTIRIGWQSPRNSPRRFNTERDNERLDDLIC